MKNASQLTRYSARDRSTTPPAQDREISFSREYDGKAGRVTNSDEANALLSRKYRAGWVLDG